MKRALIAVMVAALLLPAGAAAQDDGPAATFGKEVYQAVWCTFLNGHPFYLEAPGDVECDYEPRAMTMDEAVAYYLSLVSESNYRGARASCAYEKRKLTWRSYKKLARVGIKDDRWFIRELQSVTWPDDVKKLINQMISRSSDTAYRLGEMIEHKDYKQAWLDGDVARRDRAFDKSSEASQRIRVTLRLPNIPDWKKNCKFARKYERQQRKP